MMLRKKREGFENVISFLNNQISQFEEGNTAFEDSISALRAQFGYMDKNELQTMSSEVSQQHNHSNVDTRYSFYKVFRKLLTDNFSTIPLISIRTEDIDVSS
jgi:hypothetical protein